MEAWVWGLPVAQFLLFAVIMFVPTWKIFGVAGKSKKWAFLQAIPFFGHLILLFVLAFSKWPAVDDPAEGA